MPETLRSQSTAPCAVSLALTVERAIRAQTITPKNALFAGSDGGGRTWATIATLLQTAKMIDVDPLRLAGADAQRIANQVADLADR